MVKLYRIEGVFRYEGDWHECDVHSYGTLEVCTVKGEQEECDVDLEHIELENCIEWNEEFEDWRRIEVCDLPEGVISDIEDAAFEHLKAGDYKEVDLIGVKE